MRHHILFALVLILTAGLVSAGPFLPLLEETSQPEQLTLAEQEVSFETPDVELSRQCEEVSPLAIDDLFTNPTFQVAEGPDCVIGCWEGRAACVDACINAGGHPSCFAGCTAAFNACKDNCSGYHIP